MRRLLLPLLLTLLPPIAAAQAPPRFSLGVAVIAGDEPFRGVDLDVKVVPIVEYEGPRFFLRGLTAGWKLTPDSPWNASLIATARLRDLEGSDFDPDLDIEERKKTVEAGFALSRAFGPVTLDAEAVTDVFDRHGGYQAALRVSRRWRMGGTMVIPGAGLRYWSADTNRYYHGLAPGEAGIAEGYDPGSALVPEAGVAVIRPLGPRSALMLLGRVARLSDDTADSPLLDSQIDATVIAGISWRIR